MENANIFRGVGTENSKRVVSKGPNWHTQQRCQAAGGWVCVRVISDCHFAVQLNHFIPVLLSYSVAIF
jgi:hypothetical protein